MPVAAAGAAGHDTGMTFGAVTLTVARWRQIAGVASQWELPQDRLNPAP